ncbi:MAG TPA: hypothetical protein VH142_15470 [Polyangiaceae bacterium]|jgi:hypothetical protein|nr:hypothetical protein [Polyangiaceae bacterium]
MKYRFSPLLVFVVGFPVGCGGPPPLDPAAEAASNHRAIEELKVDLVKAHAPIVSACDNPSRPLHSEHAEVWGKDDAPPGLPSGEVETFLCRHRESLERACWNQKFSDWQRSEIEYGLVVDPSGAVLNGVGGDPDVPATAALERRTEKVSSPELARCIEDVVDSWTFPRATMPTWMRLSLRLPE